MGSKYLDEEPIALTRKERMLAALRRKPVDLVPFTTYNLHPYTGSYQEGEPSYDELMKLVVAKAGMLCKVNPKRIASKRMESFVENKVETPEDRVIHTTILHTPQGDLRSIDETPHNQPHYKTEHFIKTDEDIERYMSLPYEPHEYDIANMVAFEKELGDRGLIYTSYADPMFVAQSLFGSEEFWMRCLTNLPSVIRLIEHLFEPMLEDTRRHALACKGHDFVFQTDGPEVATPPMLPPRLFKELVTPYQKRLVEAIHNAGFLCMIHCHGKVRLVLEDIIATGADGLEPIEPPPQGDIAIEELMPICEGRLSLMGHIQDQEFYTAPPGTMTEHVEQIARAVRGRTGYVMSPTCTPFQFPASETYLRNYIEWIEAADRILT